MSAAGKASTRFSVLPGLLCDGSMWTGVIAPLSERGDVRVADFSTQDSIMAMAQTALALFDGPMIAVGHSMGGRVALEMTRLMPERIAALVLLDTGLHPKRDGEEVNRQKLVDLAYQDGMAALADAWLPPMVLESRHNEAALMVPLVRRGTAGLLGAIALGAVVYFAALLGLRAFDAEERAFAKRAWNKARSKLGLSST